MSTVYNDPRYEIRASEYRCSACEREIPCEAPYYSAVSFEAEEFLRSDYCSQCWESPEGGPEGDERTADAPSRGDGVYALWRTRRPPLPSEKPKKMRFDVGLILDFFRRLTAVEGAAEGGAGDTEASSPPLEQREELSFVFALLLIRKKVLSLVSTAEREGDEWLKVAEKKESQRSYWIKNPALDSAQLERVKVTIGELLQMQM